MARPFLGISSYYHDSAAALVIDGEIVAAAQEERFTRVRHDRSFPANAIDYCLDAASVTLSDLAAVVFHEDSSLKFDRVKSNFRKAGPRGYAAFCSVMPQWRSWKENILGTVSAEFSKRYPGQRCEIRKSTHHRSHAASAFYPSPYEKAAVLVIDGVGEWDTTSIWVGNHGELRRIESVQYPNSLGFLYSAFTQYCGFRVDSGEYKLMGLAPYGTPRYADLIRDEMLQLNSDGSFDLNLKYFAFQYGTNMIDRSFDEVLARERRDPENEPLEQFHCDVAASVQTVTEEAVLALARRARDVTGCDHLVMAGGVALNCVANGVLDRACIFKEVWVQPAAGDAGCALGAALDASIAETYRRPHLGTSQDGMKGALLGPDYPPEEIRKRLDALGAVYEDAGSDLVNLAAEYLAAGAVVGWFQGRMEFGPRALGARSILGDARSADMQKTMNLKIKYRESFRPFAPAVLEDRAQEYFEIKSPSPYMLFVSKVRPELRLSTERGLGTINDCRSTIPAVTHVDYSARVQMVSHTSNEPFYKLLDAFTNLTGSSVLVNTSFNVRGEPIVMTPEDAFICFMRTEIDVLAIGPLLLHKSAQRTASDFNKNWRSEIPLD